MQQKSATNTLSFLLRNATFLLQSASYYHMGRFLQNKFLNKTKNLHFPREKDKVWFSSFFIVRPFDTDSKILKEVVDNPNYYFWCFHIHHWYCEMMETFSLRFNGLVYVTLTGDYGFWIVNFCWSIIGFTFLILL